jgi:hypothetical protein
MRPRGGRVQGRLGDKIIYHRGHRGTKISAADVDAGLAVGEDFADLDGGDAGLV